MQKFYRLLTLLLCTLTALNSLGMAKKELYNLLIINTYSENAEWSNGVIIPIVEEVSKINNVDAYIAHINASFITNDSLYNLTEETLFKRYDKAITPDYIIMIGNMAFTLRDHVRKEWGDIPIVLCAEMDFMLPHRFYYTGNTETPSTDDYVPLSEFTDDYNMTYVLFPYYINETIDLMVRMQPEMKTLVFAADSLYFNKRFEGKGFACEAAAGLLDYLFREAGARRIYGFVEDDNIRSKRLCERLGMRREGCFKEFVTFVNNPDGSPKYEDTCVYAILEKEWNTIRQW